MRLIPLTLLVVSLLGGTAFADRDRDRDRRGDRRDHRDRRPVVRDHRDHDRRPVVRDNRDHRAHDRGRVVVRERVRSNRYRPYRGTYRADRRVVVRRPLYVNSGRFTFHNGRTVVYNRPVIRQRYYDVRIRPQVVVENYPHQYGYIWVSGSWNWNGYEWVWTSGHYEPDPDIDTYYDDDSYE